MSARVVKSIDFAAVNRAAIAALPVILTRWLPGGRVEAWEYVALNPKRADRRLGSFRVNLHSGKWSDFAIEGAAGGDPISLAAYLGDLSQVDAARCLSQMLGVHHD